VEKRKETASSLLMSVLGDDIVSDLMNELVILQPCGKR
jgi:hypothetical protein